MSKADGEKIAIKFTMPLLGEVSGNIGAFSITGQQYKYINGPLLDKSYTVAAVETHPTEPKTLLVKVDQFTRFNNAEEQLKVIYDASLGSLIGLGGAVESFERYFTPVDLEKLPNPNARETVKPVIAEVIANWDVITYKNTFGDETLTTIVSEVVAELVYVGVVNP